MTALYILLIAASAALAVVFYVRWQRAEAQCQNLREATLREAELRREAEENEAARRREAEENEAARRREAEASRREAEESARRDRQQMQEAFRAEFQLLAGRIFEEKSQAFRATNKESLDVLLKPFRDNLTEFRKRVEDIYSEENRQHGALKSELGRLMDLNRRITEETSNLTNALRGSSKVQGDWGEMILERMLESSNLQKGVHYFVQENFKDDSGANLRPDIVLTLPEGKRIVIDSKVSLTAWVDYTGAPDDTTREAALRRHVASVRAHIAELHARNYQASVADSPDFVIMFVAGEPAFVAALQADATLWAEGYNKKVIISSPTNLFALLRIVDDLWKRDTQSRHALEIARQGGALYDKFVGFVGSLEDVGRGIERVQKSYDQAWNQLKTGRGNLITSSEKLMKMGVKATKKLSSTLTESALPESTLPESALPESTLPEPDSGESPLPEKDA